MWKDLRVSYQSGCVGRSEDGEEQEDLQRQQDQQHTFVHGCWTEEFDAAVKHKAVFITTVNHFHVQNKKAIKRAYADAR